MLLKCVSVGLLMSSWLQTYITDTPGDCALLVGCGTLICLTFDAQVHDVISTDGAVVNDNIPSPKSNGVPLKVNQQA